jgi:hypothetical protein
VRATVVSQFPLLEMSWPMKNSRKFLVRSAEKELR